MKDFEILFKEGRFVAGKFLGAKVWKIEPDKYPKKAYSSEDLLFGFVVSVKVSKSAVKRNQVKRKMREVVRLLLKDGRLGRGFMVALVANPGILEQNYAEISKDIEVVLRKSGILGK